MSNSQAYQRKKSVNNTDSQPEQALFNRLFKPVRRWSKLQWLVHLSAWLILANLVWDFSSGNLSVNPIQAATQRTGKTALVFLMLSLACTPISKSFGWKQVLKVRRTLGLYAFWFALSHLFIFVVIDFGVDLQLLWIELTQKRYVWVGAMAFSILLVLAITSYSFWMKRLGKNWKRLHRLVYLAGIFVVVHYAWAKKGDIFSLQGDIIQPLIFGLVLILLLMMRLPQLQKVIQARKSWLMSKH